jgi:hypothetical protein
MEDLIKTIGKLERSSSHSLMSGTKKVLNRLCGMSESLVKRSVNSVYDASDDSITVITSLIETTIFAVDVTTGIMKEVLYKSNGITQSSKAWELIENKDDIFALNVSSIPGKPKWVPFRLSLLESRAKIKEIPLSVLNDELSLPHLVVRITNDINEAIEKPNVTVDKGVSVGGKVYSDKH